MAVSTGAGDAVRLIQSTRLQGLVEDAARAPRQRTHMLLHAGPDDQVQRLLIAAQPDTYVRPHQHTRQWEMLILQSGCADILIYDETGRVRERHTLDANAPIVEIAVSEWHSCLIRRPDTVVMEIKPGPFRPNEFAAWAPEEGNDRTREFLSWTKTARVGDRWGSD